MGGFQLLPLGLCWKHSRSHKAPGTTGGEIRGAHGSSGAGLAPTTPAGPQSQSAAAFPAHPPSLAHPFQGTDEGGEDKGINQFAQHRMMQCLAAAQTRVHIPALPYPLCCVASDKLPHPCKP